MRIFKNKDFNKWANDINLSDENILQAALDLVDGNYEASLGKKVYKKRVAVGNTGKSGSTRTIIAFQEGNNMFFIYGFAKGKKSDISPIEKIALQKQAGIYLGFNNKQISHAIKHLKIFEVENNG